MFFVTYEERSVIYALQLRTVGKNHDTVPFERRQFDLCIEDSLPLPSSDPIGGLTIGPQQFHARVTSRDI